MAPLRAGRARRSKRSCPGSRSSNRVGCSFRSKVPPGTTETKRLWSSFWQASSVAAGVEALIGVADGPFAATWAARTARGHATHRRRHPRVPGRARHLRDRSRGPGLHLPLAGGHHPRIAGGIPRDAIASRFGDVGMPPIAWRTARTGWSIPVVSRRNWRWSHGGRSRWNSPIRCLCRRGLAVSLIDGLRREGIAPHRIVSRGRNR
jgi:hypothetical protein